MLATLATRARDEAHAGRRRDRRPRHVPAGRGPLRARPLQPARGVGLLALRRGRDHRALRHRARALPAAGRAARRPVGQPARGARAWGRRPRPSSSASTATSTTSTPTWATSRPSCARTWPPSRSAPATTRRVMALVRDVAPRPRPGRPHARRAGTASEVTAFFEPLRDESGSRTRFEQAPGRGAAGPGRRRRRPAPQRAAAPDRAGRRRRRALAAGAATAPGDGGRAAATARVAAYDPRERARRRVGGVGDVPGGLRTPAPAGHDVKALYRAARRARRRPGRAGRRQRRSWRSCSTRRAAATSWPTWPSASSARRPSPDAPTLLDARRRRRARRRRAPGGAPARRAARRHRRAGSSGASTRQVELPLVKVLGRMEARGVCVDAGLLRSISSRVRAPRPRASTPQIQEAAGHEFKVNSSAQQLQVVLFDELGLHPRQEEQDRLLDRRDHARGDRRRAPDRAAGPALPRGREAALHLRREPHRRGAGRRAHPRDVPPDRRAHRAAISRQPEPAQHPGAHRGRPAPALRVHAAAPGWRLAVADYNQIELRILAHLSQDAGLLAAFAAHEDVHRTIAGVGLRRRPGRRDARAARAGQGRLLRPRLRDGGLRAQPAPRHPGAAAQGVHGPVLRRASRRCAPTWTRRSATVRAQGYSRTEFGRIRPFPDLATASGPRAPRPSARR